VEQWRRFPRGESSRLSFGARSRPLTGHLIKNRGPRGPLVITFLFFLTGCSGMKPATLPTDPADPPAGQEKIHQVKVGANAVVYLKSGEKVKGEVIKVTPNKIVLGRPSNYGYQEDTYLAADIERIETQKMTKAGSILSGTFATIGITFAVLITLLLIFPPDLTGLS